MSQSDVVLARDLLSIRQEKEELAKRVKEVNAREKELNAQLVETMADAGRQNFQQDGYTFYLATKVRASAKADAMPDLVQWMRDNDLENKVTVTVNANSLSSIVKEMTEDDPELPEDLAELVNVYEETQVNVKKA